MNYLIDNILVVMSKYKLGIKEWLTPQLYGITEVCQRMNIQDLSPKRVTWLIT